MITVTEDIFNNTLLMTSDVGKFVSFIIFISCGFNLNLVYRSDASIKTNTKNVIKNNAK